MMIANLTDTLKVTDNGVEKGKAVISGKRDLMNLLVDKTLEYFRTVDPNAEVVLQEMATQYETLIDQGINLLNEAPASNQAASGQRGAKTNPATQRQLQEKDREI